MHKAAPQNFPFADFSGGWDPTSSPNAIDLNAMADCLNFNMTPYKGLKKRDGMAKKYATAYAAYSVHSLFEYKAPNATTYILVGCNTKLGYYSAAWNDLKTGLTAGKKMSFATYLGYCFVVNGTDDNFKIYNTTVQGVGIAAPTVTPTVAEGVAGALTGKYKYVYCYARSTPVLHIGNPSAVSSDITVTSKKIDVSVTASGDGQVDKIYVYRTVNLLGEGADSTIFYYSGETSNATGTYTDNVLDSALTTECEIDNNVPPKAKFMVLHKDHMFYVNLPGETYGTTKIMWSKAGYPESVPTANYQFFDRKDGEDITGAASFGDYLVVFKRNKIGVLAGDFEQFYTVSAGIGCVAPWAILALEDKVIFLSEEGWKAFDGRNIYSISKKLQVLVDDGYASINCADYYSVAYYPEKRQFQFLINHPSLTKMILVGNFIVPLFYSDGRVPEAQTENLVSWTYHRYPNHTLTVLGTYTDANGITRLMAGSSAGYVYNLDTGSQDDGYNIAFAMLTGYSNLGSPEGVTKTQRRAYISYSTDHEDTFNFLVNKDYSPGLITHPMTGTDTSYCGYAYCGYSYCGIGGSLLERVDLKGTGCLFQYGIQGENDQSVDLYSITIHFRSEALR